MEKLAYNLSGIYIGEIRRKNAPSSSRNGATTFGITALGIMAFSIKILSIKGLFSTLSIMTFSLKTLSIKGLFLTLSITTFSINSLFAISINDIQHNSTLSVIMVNVKFYLLLC